MDFLTNNLVGLHATIFRKSGGRIGKKIGGQSVLLLHSIGRRSGKEHSNILSYYRDGADYLVVGSNWGRPANPDWFHNLMERPQTQIQVDNQTISVRVTSAEGAEYERLWNLVSAQNSYFPQKQAELSRQIPILILTPVED